MSNDRETEVLKTLKEMLKKFENNEIKVFEYQRDALRQAIEQYEKNQRPMIAYFNLENWLYEQNDKPIEIKSAMLWGGLWIVKEMGCITWDAMKKLYGEFMSKHMNVR